MQVKSPGKNAFVTALTYAGVALAVAARDPNLGFYLVRSGANGIKSLGRTQYNNKIIQTITSKNTIAEA